MAGGGDGGGVVEGWWCGGVIVDRDVIWFRRKGKGRTYQTVDVVELDNRQ